MKKLKLDIDKILSQSSGPSKWELDNITWHDRGTDPEVLREFLGRITELKNFVESTKEESAELNILIELANEMDELECLDLLSREDEIVQQNFIEKLARRSALEVLTNERVSFDTMNTMCKLSPNDFILTAKRTQDLINSIHELVIQGETLSQDVAGA
jgi:hypothetical protein